LIIDSVSVKTCFDLETARAEAKKFASAGDAVEIVKGNPDVGYEHVEWAGSQPRT
jgi:hypothetical protein